MLNPELLLKYCIGKCSFEEQSEIELALEKSEKLQRDLQKLQLTVSIANDIKEIESIDTDASFMRTKKKIKTARRQRILNQWMKYAAVLSMPLLISTCILLYVVFNPKVEEQYAEIRTPMGTITRYELPDQSIVWLNGGSMLRHPSTFTASERRVEVEGEAYFQVEADMDSPFYVTMENGLSVFVYGTKFNVNAYPDQPFIETVLEKGKVNVISPDQKIRLEMNPGERLAYNKLTNSFEKSSIDIYEKTAWKDGVLIFRNASLEDIFQRLSRHFNADIEFQNISGKEYKYRATFKSETLAQILDYLSKSADLSWKTEEPIQNDNGTLSRKKIRVRLN